METSSSRAAAQDDAAFSPLSPFSLNGSIVSVHDEPSDIGSSSREGREDSQMSSTSTSNPPSTSPSPSIPSLDQISPLPLQADSPSLLPTHQIPDLSNSNLNLHNDLNNSQNASEPTSSQSPLDHSHSNRQPFTDLPTTIKPPRKSSGSSSSFYVYPQPIHHQASFVTASAILSRSGAIYPIPHQSTSQEAQHDSNNLFRSGWNFDWSGITNQSRYGRHSDQTQGREDPRDQDSSDNQSTSGVRRKPSDSRSKKDLQTTERVAKGRETSNGSALEAFSALLLHKDTKGKVSNLSFTKDYQTDERAETEGAKSGINAGNHSSTVLLDKKKRRKSNLSKSLPSSRSIYTVGNLSEWVSNDWLEKVRLAGATRLGLMLPHQTTASRRRKEAGSSLTIAERRAKKLGLQTPLAGTTSLFDRSFSFCRVGTRYGEPVYQLEKPPRANEKAAHGQGRKVKGRVLIDGFELGETGETGDFRIDSNDENSNSLDSKKKPYEDNETRINSRNVLPPNTRLLLKRSRQDPSGPGSDPIKSSTSSYGIGSAQISLELPEAPPSPLGMPGAWSGSSSWSWSLRPPADATSHLKEDFAMEGALLLPPPLLDDGSDRNSFEGLLGIKRQRELEKKRKELERLRSRNRPDHKVGMLTAVTNFVKAAHAADTSARKSKIRQKQQIVRPSLKERSFTDPINIEKRESFSRNESDINGSPEIDRKTPVHPNHTNLGHSLDQDDHLGGFSSPQMARSFPKSRQAEATQKPRNRSSAISRSLTSSVSSTSSEEDLEALETLDQVSQELSSSFSSLNELPRAPKLLPVQLSIPPSPATSLTGIGGGTSSSRRSSINDQHSARGSTPGTPRLGPTLMSLPPSPWTPHLSSSQTPPPTNYQFHLNTTSINGPPGTPKLVPTHLEVLPSPFPTPSVSNHRTSFGFAQPSSLRMTNLVQDSAKSTRKSMSNSSSSSSLSSSRSHSPKSSHSNPMSAAPLVLSPTQLAADSKPILTDLSSLSLPPTPSNDSTSVWESDRKKKRRLKASHLPNGINSPQRLTPASMLADFTQNDQAISSAMEQVPPPAPRLGPMPPGAQAQSMSPILSPAQRRNIFDRNEEDGALSDCRRKDHSTSAQSDSQSISKPKAQKQRSFLIWFLVGDLWLDTRSKLNIGSAKSGYLGGIAGFAFHFLNFVVFVLAHLLAFISDLTETLSLAFWFLRWIVLNLSGKTVLSRCLIEAHALISNEWRTVALEDHENRGNHEKRIGGGEILKKPKGLTKFQVLRGLAELAALQNVTRERYLREGSGLIKLEGWEKEKKRKVKGGSARRNGSESFELEKTKLRPVDEFPRRDDSFNSIDSQDPQDEEQDKDDLGEDGESSSDEDEGDIVVTKQGEDILELTKTPRIHPVLSLSHRSGPRPSMSSRNPSGYFAGNVPLDQKRKEKGEIDDPTWSENPRLLIKTIKWASRLAISAYGLHVHIVDLPPTFTPSGERFSRQTFAHLSRLNAEDVLHADIQTLDSEANYSPTFYVVRDYARKVVVVAVRGTQSFSDIIVDLEMQTERVDLRDIDGISSGSDEPLLCHAGILRAARALVARDSTLLDTLQAALEENEDFGVCFTGHSLGGSVAALAALLLSEYNTDGVQDGNTSKGRWLTSSSSGLPSKRPIRAITFAPPATVSAALAERASLGIVPLVTTTVLGSDIIPRAGHGQARELRRVLGALSRVRRRHESAFTSNTSSNETEDDARVHIIKSWWDWRSICMAVRPDAVMLHRKDTIEEQLWRLRCDVEADLYAAVKSRHDESSDSQRSSSSSISSSTRLASSRSRIPPSPWVGPQQRAKAPLHQLATRRQAIDAATLRSESAQGVLPVLFPAGRSIWISGSEIYVVTSPLAFFSLPDLHPSMFAEHFPSAYESAFEDLPI